MKTQTRMILASVVVIALALTAVSGITYSWYSDDEQTEITVTAGKIDYELNITSLKDKSSYDRAEATDITSEYAFGVSAKAKVDATTNAITLSNLADKDAILIGMNIVNNSTIATVYRVSATYDGDLCGYITPTIKVGSTEVSNVTPWLNAVAPETPTTTEASIMIAFDSSNAALASDANAKITLKVEAYQENCTDLPAYTVTKTVVADATVSQKFSNSSSDVKTAEVSFKAELAGDYKISPITAPENSSYTIQSGTTTNEVLSGISVSADGVDLSNQSAVLNFTVGSTLVNSTGTALADAIKIVHQKSDGTTETINLTTAKNVGEDLTAIGDYRLTSNDDGTYTLEMFVTGFSSYLVVADADAYVVDADGKKTYYTTLKNALAPNSKYKADNDMFSGDLTLLRDVVFTEAFAVKYFEGTLDGNGHTITCGADPANFLKTTSVYGGAYAAIAEEIRGTTVVKDLKYKMRDGCAVWGLFGYSYGDLTFSNVEVLETTSKVGSLNSAFVYCVEEGTTVFDKCINRANFVGTKVESYAGAFVGGYAWQNTTVKFIDCVNYGDMTMSGPGIYFGYVYKQCEDCITLEISDCVNYGVITYTSYGPYIGGKWEGFSNYVSTLESGTTQYGQFVHSTDPDMKLVKNGDTITITPSSDSAVGRYEVSYTSLATSDKDYMKTTIALVVNPEDAVKEYTIIDEDTFAKIGTVSENWLKSKSANYRYQIVDNYIVIKYDAYGVKYTVNDSEPTLYLSSYDSSGKLLATVTLTETTATTDAS